MPIQVVGNGGKLVEVDGGRNLIGRRGIPDLTGAASYVVTGGPVNGVGASQSAGATFAYVRHGTTATTQIFATRLRLTINVYIAGAIAGAPGVIAWQRFSAATPTGGTARTPARKRLDSGIPTQLLGAADLETVLTTTGATFGDVVHNMMVPNMLSLGTVEYILDLEEDEFIRLGAGDGLCLRVQSATPATMRWTYTWTIHYLESP